LLSTKLFMMKSVFKNFLLKFQWALCS
jgi:hypothetical protein